MSKAKVRLWKGLVHCDVDVDFDYDHEDQSVGVLEEAWVWDVSYCTGEMDQLLIEIINDKLLGALRASKKSESDLVEINL